MINPPQALREKPILFSAPMVRAILEGRKTQTRRVVKFPKCCNGETPKLYLGADHACGLHVFDGCGMWGGRLKPRYAVGDRLWVRETWLYYEPSPVIGQGKNELPENPTFTDETLEFHRKRIVYQASCSARQREDFAEFGYKWRPSIFMPRWASRITLEVTGVSVERLQDISIVDSLNEGIRCPDCGYTSVDAGIHMDHGICVNRWLAASQSKDVGDHPAVTAYAALWESINGEGSWEANPWVEVYEFRRVA